MKPRYLIVLFIGLGLTLPIQKRDDPTTDATAIEYGLASAKADHVGKRTTRCSGGCYQASPNDLSESESSKLVKRPSQMSKVGKGEGVVDKEQRGIEKLNKRCVDGCIQNVPDGPPEFARLVKRPSEMSKISKLSDVTPDSVKLVKRPTWNPHRVVGTEGQGGPNRREVAPELTTKLAKRPWDVSVVHGSEDDSAIRDAVDTLKKRQRQTQTKSNVDPDYATIHAATTAERNIDGYKRAQAGNPESGTLQDPYGTGKREDERTILSGEIFEDPLNFRKAHASKRIEERMSTHLSDDIFKHPPGYPNKSP